MIKELRNAVVASFILSISALFYWIALVDICAIPAHAAEARLHLLAVGDTNDQSIGQSVHSDLYHVGELFRANVPDRQLKITIVEGEDVWPRGILSKARGLEINPGMDTIVFYYSGHGFYDTQSNEHAFRPGGKRLDCKDVQSAIVQLRPKLLVLISDTCSVFIPRPVPAPAYPPAERLSLAFKTLFFDPSGMIFVSSTRPSQEAKCDSSGGYFTSALSSFLHENKERSLTWPVVLRRVNIRVAATYSNARQTAYIVSQSGVNNSDASGGTDDGLSLQPGRLRFGVTAERTNRSARWDGVEVLRVEPNSPAMALRSRSDGKQYYLVPGRDVITHVNGNPVTTNGEIIAAVRNSPPNMVVRVHDMSTGSTENYDVQLENGSSPNPADNAQPDPSSSVPGPNAQPPSDQLDSQGAGLYAAIALSSSTSKYGFAHGHGSREAAERAAVSYCGVSDARVVIYARNAYCALAFGPMHAAWGAAWGNSADEAAKQALANCGKHTPLACHVAVCVAARDGVININKE